ncbi:MAG: helix-turn-helix domain-containing protein [Ilumatobacteraceae bacterium]
MDTHTFVLDRRDRLVVAALDLDRVSALLQVGDEIAVLPPEANRAVRTLLAALATGAVVHVIRTDGELTAQQAADVLDVGRADVIRLVDRGVLRTTPSTSGRRLFSAREVLDYRQQRAARLAALGQMTEAAEELGETY